MHMSNDLRSEFEAEFEAWSKSRSREVPANLKALAGRLWNCSDIAPRWIPETIDKPAGMTFAQVARHLRAI